MGFYCYTAAATEDAASHADLMLLMIHRRASDDKVVVRKAAIQVLSVYTSVWMCVSVCLCVSVCVFV